MGKYENIFAQVGKARSLTAWEPSLPVGRHRLAIVKYGGKSSNKDKSVYLEAEFVVMNTDNAAVRIGGKYSWPWFINKPDEYGYTHARAKNFLEVLQKCMHNDADPQAFGNTLAEDFEHDDPVSYGILIDAVVTGVLDTQGNPRLGKKGNEVTNVTWIAVEQDADTMATTRAVLASPATPTPPPAKPVPTQVTIAQDATRRLQTLLKRV